MDWIIDNLGCHFCSRWDPYQDFLSHSLFIRLFDFYKKWWAGDSYRTHYPFAWSHPTNVLNWIIDEDQIEHPQLRFKKPYSAIKGISYFSYQTAIVSRHEKRVKSLAMTSFCTVSTLEPTMGWYEILVWMLWNRSFYLRRSQVLHGLKF